MLCVNFCVYVVDVFRPNKVANRSSNSLIVPNQLSIRYSSPISEIEVAVLSVMSNRNTIHRSVFFCFNSIGLSVVVDIGKLH